MKIILDKDTLLKKLSLASRFTSTRLTTASSLLGVLVEKKADKIGFYSTNLVYYYQSQITEETSKEDFRIVVEARKIIEFLSLIPQEKVEIDIKDKSLSIITERSKGSFPLMMADEFPLPPKMNHQQQKIKTNFFTNSLPLVAFSSSQDESRPALTGVNFLTQDENMIFVSTDGFRLSLLKSKKEIDIKQAIIPSNFLMEVLSLVKGQDEIGFNYSEEEKAVLFSSGDDSFYSRLIEGEFPQFERVIPTDKKTSIEVERQDLLRNIKLVSIFARDFSNIVVFRIENKKLLLSPKTELQDDNSTIQEAVITGEDQKIAFNHKFILDFLNHTDSKKIIIEINRSDAPAVFRTDKNPGFIHIIMPVRIQ